MVRISPNRTASGYFVHEAANLAGLSRVMLDYLSRTGVLAPTHSGARGRGRKRIYSFGDVVMLRAIAAMLKSGISVSRLKAGLVALRRHHPEITPTSLPASKLLSDGKSVFLKSNREVVEDLRSGQLAFAFVIELSALQREIGSKVASQTKKNVKKRAYGT